MTVASSSSSDYTTQFSSIVKALNDLTFGSVPLKQSFVNYITGPWRLLLFPLHVLRVITLRCLLAYSGWSTRPNATSTKVYFALLKFLVRYPEPAFQSLQKSIPCLPLPSLKESCDKLVTSVEPLLSPEELAKTKSDLDLFQTTSGPKLQFMLECLYWSKDNWLSELWLRAAYLMTRDFLPCAASWYSSGPMAYVWDPPTSNQAERAATLTYSALQVREDILTTRTFKGLYSGGALPLCMNGYQDTFGTVRVPKKDEDILVNHPKSSHIAVLASNYIFKVEVVHKNGDKATVKQLMNQFEFILAQVAKMKSEGVTEPAVCVMTSQQRDWWAEKREHLIAVSTNNAKSIEMIESSAFVVSLDEGSPTTQDEYSVAMQHNNGQNRWFDKAVGIMVFKNGHCGTQFEHSFADASVNGHVWEEIVSKDCCMYTTYHEKAKKIASKTNKPCFPELYTKIAQENARKTDNRLEIPTMVRFDLTSALIKACNLAQVTIKHELTKISQGMTVRKGLGKNDFKRLKISPDAFMQMSLQLAHRRVMGKYTLTYEPVSMRMWRMGRTETNRVCSTESKKFCEAMLARDDASNKNMPTKEEAVRLLREAAVKHVHRIRNAIGGQGVDRHIMSLQILAKMSGTDTSGALDGPAFQLPWGLITSTTPLMYGPKYSHYVGNLDDSMASVGGGFTCYSPNSLGIAYFFFNDAMSFHTTARVGEDIVDPNETREKFVDALFTAMNDIYAIHQ
eukprot:CFRG2244T1